VSAKFRSEAIERVYKLAIAQGWRVEDRRRHVALWPLDGTSPVMLSKTAYDGPANRRIEAIARRKGLRIPPK
jgi:hypothetical protein